MNKNTFSNRVTWYNFILCIFVVWIHAQNTDLFTEVVMTEGKPLFNQIEQTIVSDIAVVGVAGFFLLYIFGVKRPVGRFFLEFFGTKIAFSWQATVLAAVAISFPLMYRSARGALQQVDENLLYAGRTLGMSEWCIFWKVWFPNAMSGILSGGILAFARGLGEFGATAMIAGNIAGETRTLPLAVYSAVSAGNMEEAYQYVWILVIISFLVVTGMNAVTHGFQKFSRR